MEFLYNNTNARIRKTIIVILMTLGLVLSMSANTLAATLSAPAIKSISSTQTSVTLSWNKITGASGYEVCRGSTSLGKQTALSKTDSGLTASTSYSYKVRAYKKTTVKTKYYYNSKTKKWVTKKPSKKCWKGKKTKYVSSTKYSYSSYSAVKSIKTKAPTVVAIRSSAPKASENVLKAFETLGFKVVIDPNAKYTGCFSAQDRSITLRANDTNVYHELGHFVAFVAGNVDTGSSFKAIYDEEKSLYDGRNSGYVLSSPSEYFAESYREYVLGLNSLKTNRPKTYTAIENAVNRITDAQVDRILKLYGSIWE